jgi:hypothetical protein
MREKQAHRRSLKAQSKAAVRASISFPPDLYETLEEIAEQKKSVVGLGSPRRGGKICWRHKKKRPLVRSN